MNGPRTALVAGGGLAGIAAACRLAGAGVRVTLIEKRPFLGGRVYSSEDRGTGAEADNGQHVFLGCCTEYMRFLKELGVYHQVHLQKRLRVRVIDKVRGESVLRSGDLPPPLHLLPSLLRFRSLSPREKVLAIRALAALRSVTRPQRRELDGVTFGEWLREHRQTGNAIRSLWDLIVRPTLNDDASRVSADLALMVFQEGFLRSRDGANVGWAKVSLNALLSDASRRYIEERGGEVLTGVAVEGIQTEGGRVSGVAVESRLVTADAYVVAVPPDRLISLLPLPLRIDPFFARAGRITSSPIVNVHLWYDRPVWDGGFAAFLNSPLQWVFNKSRLWGIEGPSQYLDISLSGAHEFADLPGQEIIGMFVKELAAMFPAARGATVARALVIRQPQATFAPVPGIAALRPPQRTPVAGLFLAGDWTDTGWPATMESAVRSGVLAADAVLASGRAVAGEEVVTAV